jgi:hypothetical protein
VTTPTQTPEADVVAAILRNVAAGVDVQSVGDRTFLALNPLVVRLLTVVSHETHVSVRNLLVDAVMDAVAKRLSLGDTRMLQAVASALEPWGEHSADFEEIITQMAEYEHAAEGVDPAEGKPRYNLQHLS